MVFVIQSKEELNSKIAEAGEKLIIIDFFANWCGPCKIISPKLDELAAKYEEHAMILKINVDDNEDIALEYNVTGMPTFVFIKNNEVIDVFVGGNTEKLVKNVEKYVAIELNTQTSQPSMTYTEDDQLEEESQQQLTESPANFESADPIEHNEAT